MSPQPGALPSRLGKRSLGPARTSVPRDSWLQAGLSAQDFQANGQSSWKTWAGARKCCVASLFPQITGTSTFGSKATTESGPTYQRRCHAGRSELWCSDAMARRAIAISLNRPRIPGSYQLSCSSRTATCRNLSSMGFRNAASRSCQPGEANSESRAIINSCSNW